MRRTPSLGNAEKWFQVFVVGIQCVGSVRTVVSSSFVWYKGIAELKGHLQGEQHFKVEVEAALAECKALWNKIIQI